MTSALLHLEKASQNEVAMPGKHKTHLALAKHSAPFLCENFGCAIPQGHENKADDQNSLA